jgi:hypothetical protein
MEKYMNQRTTILTAFALALPLALPVWAQTRELPTETRTISGTIETIDQSKRAMNIKTADGEYVAVNVPSSVKRFDELKVGNHITATYNNNVIASVKPPGEPDLDTVAVNDTKDPSSGKQVVTRKMTATITALDKDTSSISFEGVNGWKYSRRVVDPTVFDQVKVGDKVDITWSTDLTIAVR